MSSRDREEYTSTSAPKDKATSSNSSSSKFTKTKHGYKEEDEKKTTESWWDGILGHVASVKPGSNVKCVQLSEQILSNITKMPKTYKYRKLHIKHPTLKEDFFPHDFVIQLLSWCGFKKRGDYIVLPLKQNLKRCKDALKRLRILDQEWFEGEYSVGSFL